MLSLSTLEAESTSKGNGVKSSCYVVGDKAYLTTSIRHRETLRYKFEVWKELGKIHGIERSKDSPDSVIFVLDALEPIAKWEGSYDFYGDKVYIDSSEKESLEIERDKFKDFRDLYLDDRGYYNLYISREVKNQIAIDYCWECATNPQFPSYNAAFIALINAGMESKTSRYVYGIDDHFGNFMIDPITRKVLPIDIINI